MSAEDDRVLHSESDMYVSLLSVLKVEILSEDVVAIVDDSLDAIDVFECAEIILQLPEKELIEEEDDISLLFSKA